MASEKNVSKIMKELGFEPKEHACIVVKYAPDDSLCSKLSNFFTLEYYIVSDSKETVLQKMSCHGTTSITAHFFFF